MKKYKVVRFVSKERTYEASQFDRLEYHECQVEGDRHYIDVYDGHLKDRVFSIEQIEFEEKTEPKEPWEADY